MYGQVHCAYHTLLRQSAGMALGAEETEAKTANGETPLACFSQAGSGAGQVGGGSGAEEPIDSLPAYGQGLRRRALPSLDTHTEFLLSLADADAPATRAAPTPSSSLRC
jgi:hypothetical protein